MTPMLSRRSLLGLGLSLSLAACAGRRPTTSTARDPGNLHTGETPEMRALIVKWSAIHGIPESLMHRIIQRESGYNPGARHANYWGLLQIDPRTAHTMGYRGPAEGLLDAETNLHYAGKYLRGAWLVSGGSQDRAVMWYAKGYYYEAKRKGLLKETGLKS